MIIAFTIITPSHLHSFITPVTHLRPIIPRPVANKKLTERCLRFYVSDTINERIFPNNVTDKIFTHSYDGFTNYAKKHTIHNYSEICHIRNCVSCE